MFKDTVNFKNGKLVWREEEAVVEKMREIACDPMKCFISFFVVNSFLFGLCAAGYWNLDGKIERLPAAIAQHTTTTTTTTLVAK